MSIGRLTFDVAGPHIHLLRASTQRISRSAYIAGSKEKARKRMMDHWPLGSR